MTGLRPLSRARTAEALRLCEQFPFESVPIAGWLAEGGLDAAGPPPDGRGWLFAEEDASGAFRSLALVTSVGIVYPLGRTLGLFDGLSALARANPGTFRVIVGQRETVDALWERLGGLGLRARAIRRQQLMSVDAKTFVGHGPGPELMTATPSSLETIVSASAAMAREESRDDPQRRNPRLFEERIAARIARGRDFLLERDGALVFKCNVSALSPLAGQIEGIYTTPSFRGRGHGTAGAAWATNWVLSRSRRVVLLVNDDNAGAQRLYQRLGYRFVHSSRTVFIAP